ncbi:MAG: hypothetical protein FWG16_03805 [Micrococcales bacterium]|nr:hypothetical protein [Micrococcales bacterium]
MKGPRLVSSPADADALAGTINSAQRTKPVVVISIRAGERSPLIDAETVASELEGLADVWVLPTSSLSWRLADQLPPHTQVYGGAARVYPVGNGWIANPRAWPLRWGTNLEEAKQAGEALVSDAMTAAFQVGLLAGRSEPIKTSAMQQGTVIGAVADRAIVQLENGQAATIWRELTVPAVGIENLVQTGQQVQGELDGATRRLDVRRSVVQAETALAEYQVGDQVLVRIVKVTEQRLDVELFPGVMVSLPAHQIAASDRLTDLFNPDEVMRARITARQPWALSLDQIDDAGPLAAVPAVLPGGPPWLTEPIPEPPPARTFFGEIARRIHGAPVAKAQPAPQAKPPLAAPIVPDRPPSPGDLAARRGISRPPKQPSVAPPAKPAPPPKPAPPQVPAPQLRSPDPLPPKPGPRAEVAPAGSPLEDQIRQMTATSDALMIQRDRAQTEVEGLRRRLSEAEEDLDSLRRERDFADQRGRETAADFHQAKAEADHLRRRLRQATVQAKKAKTDQEALPDLVEQLEGRFEAPEAQFNFELQVAWALRVSPGEKADLPLASYSLGPRFLPSLETLHGVDRIKVLEVVVDVLTGRAQDLSGRQLHRRKVTQAGRNLVRQDGAVGWRVAIQRGAPSARRLHYWQIGPRIELDKVGVHDQVD